MSVSRAADLAVAAAPRPAASDRKRELHEVVSLEEWKALPPDQQQRLLSPDPAWGATSFNREVNDDIGWAKWSWNPVIGCLHRAHYCYARDIANGAKWRKSFRSASSPLDRAACSPQSHQAERMPPRTGPNVTSLSAPWLTFSADGCQPNGSRPCSRPAAPLHEWTFLFLTKFPQRMAEFELPRNGWYGTTVDLQARVKNAEQVVREDKGRYRRRRRRGYRSNQCSNR